MSEFYESMRYLVTNPRQIARFAGASVMLTPDSDVIYLVDGFKTQFRMRSGDWIVKQDGRLMVMSNERYDRQFRRRNQVEMFALPASDD